MAAESGVPKAIPLFSAWAAALLSRGKLRLPHTNERCTFEASEQDSVRGSSHPPSLLPSFAPSGEAHCLSCQTSFSSREEQILHYRLDWHRYNLKRRMKGQAAVSQEEFERISGDLSSISGSESSSESDGDREEEDSLVDEIQLGGSPFIHFTAMDGTLYGVYRNLIMNTKTSPSQSSLLDGLRSLSQLDQTWIILMKAGGHFAGAVFKGSTLLVHKTFHRYTVRAKRGTAQSVRDAQRGGHQPKSAGASLRRYNELALENEIQTLIASWSQYVHEATAIFIRTPKYSRSIFVGGKKSPFSREDQRLRTIPFPTRRPTLAEVKAVHSKLATVYVRPSALPVGGETVVSEITELSKEEKTGCEKMEAVALEDLASEEVEAGEAKGGKKRKLKRKEKQKSAGEAVKKDIPIEACKLLRLCRDGMTDPLADFLARMGLKPVTLDTPLPLGEDREGAGEDVIREGDSSQSLELLNRLYDGQTALHVATESGQDEVVDLLLQYGASPAIRSSSGHTPYILARDKAVRDTFRRFMAKFPQAYNYESSQIPSALTEEMEKVRREKLAEKKRAQKKAKKLREKERRAEEELEASEKAQKATTATLSDRDKRAMAAEKRMIQQLPVDSAVRGAGVCAACGRSLAGLVPFERLTYKYCSMACVKEHRTQLGKT